MSIKFTQEEAEQKSLDIGAILIGQYINTDTKTKFKCPLCNQIFKRTPHDLWSTKLILCKKCGHNKRGQKSRLTQTEADLRDKKLGFIRLEKYKGQDCKHLKQ